MFAIPSSQPAVNFLTVKLYCLSLIVTLNARARLGPKNVNTHANSTFALSKVNSSGNSNNNNSKIVTIPKVSDTSSSFVRAHSNGRLTCF